MKSTIETAARPPLLKAETARRLFWVVLLAILLRLVYQALILDFGGSFDNGSDSGKYLGAARSLLDHGVWPETDRLPLYVAFIATIFKIVGSESLRAVVTMQALFDGLSVIGIALSARAFNERLVVPAALTAAILPNFLVHASYILQENLFLLFFSWGLCALLWSLKSERRVGLLVIAGVLFGLTLWTRLTLSYFALLLIPTLAIAFRIDRKLPWARCILISIIPAITMLAVVVPRLAHNYANYGHAALSRQSGDHMLHWIYGCLATSWPCADRGKVVADLRPVVAEHIRSLGAEGANPYATSAMMQKLAVQRILELPVAQVALGMSWGAFRNLMQTGFYQVLGQFKQPLTFFSAMQGSNFAERAIAFVMTNKTHAFMIMWVLSQIALVLSRVVQAFGVVTGLRRPEFRGMTILLLLTIGNMLAINGPLADPKYRIPAEPALVVLFALGLTQYPRRIGAKSPTRNEAAR